MQFNVSDDEFQVTQGEFIGWTGEDNYRFVSRDAARPTCSDCSHSRYIPGERMEFWLPEVRLEPYSHITPSARQFTFSAAVEIKRRKLQFLIYYTSRAYAAISVSVCLSVCLSVTEVHWRIIANYLGFKFRSKFTAHCGRSHCFYLPCHIYANNICRPTHVLPHQQSKTSTVYAGALWSRCMPGIGEGSYRAMLATARPSCS